MMSPGYGELDSTGNSLSDGVLGAPPDLLVSTQTTPWFSSDSGRHFCKKSEKRGSVRPVGDLGRFQGPEVQDKLSLIEGEKLQRRQKIAPFDKNNKKYDGNYAASKPRSSSKPSKFEPQRDKTHNAYYGLSAQQQVLLADSLRESYNLSHVERWIREQEFLRYRPEDINLFISDQILDADNSSCCRRSSAHSSSVDGSASTPLRYSGRRFAQSVEETCQQRNMKSPVGRQMMRGAEIQLRTRDQGKSCDLQLGTNITRKIRTPPNYEDSIRSNKGSHWTDSYLRKGNDSDIRNGVAYQNKYLPARRTPSFNRLKGNDTILSDSHSLDRKYSSQRQLNCPPNFPMTDELTSHLPDVAREATQSTNIQTYPNGKDSDNKLIGYVNGNVVLRRAVENGRFQSLDDRKIKAQSWPKFTVTSTVMPSAKKVRVTPVGSQNSATADENEVANNTVAAQVSQLAKTDLTAEEDAFIKRYILTDDAEEWDVEDESKVVVKPTQYLETNEDSHLAPHRTTSNCALKNDSSGNITSEVSHLSVINTERDGFSNLSTAGQETDSGRDYEAALNTLPERKYTKSYPSPASASDSTFKARSALEHKASNFRQSAGYKRASGGLRDLIRLHEQEIARVSRNDSCRKPAIPPNNRKENLAHRHTSLGIGAREKSEIDFNDVDVRWKRHTTIGLINLNEEATVNGELVSPSIVKPSPLSACPDTEVDDECTSSNSVSTGVIPQNDKTPPPLPPKPKYFAESVSSPKKSTNQVQESPIRFRSLSRRSEEEALNELEKVTRTLESFKSLSIERAEACCQTEIRLFSEGEVNALMSELKESLLKQQEQLNKEILDKTDLEQKLNEQRKVANAYQKLEDRYRRKVHDLQRVLMACTCGASHATNRNKHNYNINNTFPRHGKNITKPSTVNEEKTATKVDGILQELETWLNTQQGTKTTSSSEELSTIHLQARSMENLRLPLTDGRKARENPPFEILDEIDATCV